MSSSSATPEMFATFGALLRFLRVRARLSQRELSIAVGYSEAHLSRLEAGQRRPDPDAVRAHFLPALALEHDSLWAIHLLTLAAPDRGTTDEAHALPVARLDAPPKAPPPPPAPGAGLLATKIARPLLRPNPVQRAHLLARLDALTHTPLTLVSAPAGFGKSTLLVEWLASVERSAQNGEQRSSENTDPGLRATLAALRSCWLSLDDGDNDPVVFLRYVITALQGPAPGSGSAALALLEVPQPPPLPAVLIALINALVDVQYDVVLVLDDYHVIVNPLVHELVATLVERLPPRLHLVLAARADPPLPLARLRARGQLLELRAADLRFREDEVAHFLRTTMGLAISNEVAAALGARTEGWAVGLQLAALALREQNDPDAFVAAFAGSNRYVLDYLAEEVLARLPAHLLRFLIQTAFLERLSGPLCDAVLGVPAGQGDSYSRLLLRELERLQLFLVPLDSEGGWYRYHHLFAEVLRARLHQGAPVEQVRELYRRAAEAEPAPERVVGYLLDGQLWDEAAVRITAEGGSLLAHGQHATLAGWAMRLPDSTRAQPRLQVLHGIAVARLGQTERAEALLEAGLAGCREAGDGEGQSMALAELALHALVRGDLAPSLSRFAQALALPARPAVRAYTLVCAIGAYTLGERLDLVERSAAELFALVRASDDRELLASALVGANALAACVADQLSELEQLCRRGLALLGERESLVSVSAGAALAHIAWQRGRVDEALEQCVKVREAWERFGVYGPIEPQMLAIAGACAVVGGDLAGGADHYTAALRSGAQVGIYRLSQPGQIYMLARAYWQLGHTDELRALEDELAGAGVEGSGLKELMGALLRALLALAEGRHADAATLLAGVAAREADIALMLAYGSAHPLLAHLALMRGRQRDAALALGPLLGRCASENRPGRLLFEGPYIVPLLEAAVAEGVHAPFAAHTLALWNTARYLENGDEKHSSSSSSSPRQTARRR